MEQPTNLNLFQAHKYQMTIARVPNFTYYCQTIDIPGLTMAELPVPGPGIDNYIPNSKPVFEPLLCTFQIDEDLRSWTELYNWMWSKTFGENQTIIPGHPFNRGEQPGSFYSTVIITFYNTRNTPTFRFNFENAFPVLLGGIRLHTNESNVPLVTSDVTFRYTKYTFQKI